MSSHMQEPDEADGPVGKRVRRATVRSGPQVYLSYSHRDRPLVEEFRHDAEGHSADMKQPLNFFYDLDIPPGTEWDRQLRENLTGSDAVLFFLSPAALQSQYMWTVEVPMALQMAAERGFPVMPVLLAECPWQGTPLARFQLYPPQARPIGYMKGRRKVWLDLSDLLLKALAHTRSRARKAVLPLPAGPDRLRFALYAALEQPAVSGVLENLDPHELASLWQQFAGTAASSAEALAQLASRHGHAQPQPLWAAWVATVQAERLGD